MKVKVKKSINTSLREKCNSYSYTFGEEEKNVFIHPNQEMLALIGEYVEVERFEKDRNWFLQNSKHLFDGKLYWHKNWLQLEDQLEFEF